MKHLVRLMIFVLFAGFSSDAGAQEPERGSVLPGFIITLKGDTIKGYLLNSNLWLNQNMTFFYDDPENFKGRIKYKPKEIKAYQVGPRFYESLEYPFTYSTHKQSFILKKIDGPIKLYIWYYDSDRSQLNASEITMDGLTSSFNFDESKLLTEEYGMKKDGEITKLCDLKFTLKFAKNMADYVKDDAELAQKIREKNEGYQIIDIQKIILEYNARNEK